jgi:ACT domain-containing protein
VMEVYNKTMREHDEWTERFKYIMGIKDILDSHPDVKKTDSVVRHHLTITTTWQKHTQLINDFEEGMEGNCKIFVVHLKTRTNALLSPLAAARAYLLSDEIADHESDPQEVCLLTNPPPKIQTN